MGHVEVVIANRSGVDVRGAKLDFGGEVVSAGILPNGCSKSSLGIEWKNRGACKLKFMDWSSAAEREIEVALPRNLKIEKRGGYLRLTVSLESLSKASLSVEQE
jgi:hypothetical protein